MKKIETCPCIFKWKHPKGSCSMYCQKYIQRMSLARTQVEQNDFLKTQV